MQRYRLGEIYHNLRLAVRTGRVAEASRLLGEALDVALPPAPLPARLPVTLQPMLSYRGFKPAELAMLAADLKPVVKFEDLPIALADAFTQRHENHFRILRGQTYRKDYLLLRSSPTPPGEHALVTLYVSRGDEGARLRDLEANHREDFRGAGRLLGFPDCCVEAFAEDFARSRADQDTLNDDACRRLLTSAASPEAALNPLSDNELLAYYPCRLDCPASLKRAAEVACALDRSQPGAAARLPIALGAPTIYWRLPFFGTLTGSWSAQGLRVEALVLNAFPDPEVQRVQRWWARHLAGLLAPDALLRQHAGRLHAELPAGGTIDLGPGALVRWHVGLLTPK